MGEQFVGKVALITGAARGQGRAHAVRFAEEGADIIAFDLCGQIESVAYPLATRKDLAETVDLVEKTGRRIVAEVGDVRSVNDLQNVVHLGTEAFGRVDFVLANAGIMPGSGERSHTIPAYVDAIDVLLNGVYYTIEAAMPALLGHGDGGAIVITSSAAGMRSLCNRFDRRSDGFAGYHAAKHGVVGLMKYYATALAEKNIRVNTVHPTGVNTPMIMNEVVLAEAMGKSSPEEFDFYANLLPVPVVEPADIAAAMVYLCGESGRYITGVQLPVDAGYSAK